MKKLVAAVLIGLVAVTATAATLRPPEPVQTGPDEALVLAKIDQRQHQLMLALLEARASRH